VSLLVFGGTAVSLLVFGGTAVSLLVFGGTAVGSAGVWGCCGGFWWANQWQNSASTFWRWVLSPSSDKTHHKAEDGGKTHHKAGDGGKTHRSTITRTACGVDTTQY